MKTDRKWKNHLKRPLINQNHQNISNWRVLFTVQLKICGQKRTKFQKTRILVLNVIVSRVYCVTCYKNDNSKIHFCHKSCFLNNTLFTVTLHFTLIWPKLIYLKLFLTTLVTSESDFYVSDTNCWCYMTSQCSALMIAPDMNLSTYEILCSRWCNILSSHAEFVISHWAISQ